MPVVGRAPEHGTPGPPGGCAIGKLIGGAGGWELTGPRPGGLIGSKGSSPAVSGREAEPDCMMSEGAMGVKGPGRGHVPGNPMGLGACTLCPVNSCG